MLSGGHGIQAAAAGALLQFDAVGRVTRRPAKAQRGGLMLAGVHGCRCGGRGAQRCDGDDRRRGRYSLGLDQGL